MPSLTDITSEDTSRPNVGAAPPGLSLADIVGGGANEDAVNEMFRSAGLGALADPETRAAWARSIARAPATIFGGPVDAAGSVYNWLSKLVANAAPQNPVGGSQSLAQLFGMPMKEGDPNADVIIGMLGPSLFRLLGHGAYAAESALTGRGAPTKALELEAPAQREFLRDRAFDLYNYPSQQKSD